MKIAVVFDTLHPDWEDADYKKEIEAKAEEAEYDVARGLMGKGHDVLLVGVADQLAPVLDRLAAFQPKLVFNGCESFRGHARHEYARRDGDQETPSGGARRKRRTAAASRRRSTRAPRSSGGMPLANKLTSTTTSGSGTKPSGS